MATLVAIRAYPENKNAAIVRITRCMKGCVVQEASKTDFHS